MLAVAVEAQGWEDVLVRSLAATLRSVFPHVVALPTAEPPDQLGCVVLLAADRPLACPDAALPDVRARSATLTHWVAMQQTHAWFNRYEPAMAGRRNSSPTTAILSNCGRCASTGPPGANVHELLRPVCSRLVVALSATRRSMGRMTPVTSTSTR